MLKASRFLHLALILCLAVPAGVACAKEKGKGGPFDFAKTRAFMCEMETRPDFPVSLGLANDYVYSLLAMGNTIAPARKSAIVGYLKNAQQKNGGFVGDKTNKSPSLLNTDQALETLGYLHATGAVDTARVKSFVASLKNPDGGFGLSAESKGSSLASTFYALHILKALGGLELVDKAKTAAYLKGFERKEGGFGYVKGTGTADTNNTYRAIFAMDALGVLDDATRKNAVKFLAATPYAKGKSGQRPELDEELHAVEALKVLKASQRIDKDFAMIYLKKLYIEVNGGFGPLVGYGSTPDSTATALHVLAELGKLKVPVVLSARK